jgi:hypothetical protein
MLTLWKKYQTKIDGMKTGPLLGLMAYSSQTRTFVGNITWVTQRLAQT